MSDPANAAVSQLRHDLRTPINHIIGYSELLGEELADLDKPDVLSDLNKIRQAGQTLLELINAAITDQGIASLEAGEAQELPEASAREDIEGESATLAAVPRSDGQPALTGRILIVDDNSENREMLARRLERQGHSTDSSPDGAHALLKLREEAYDLVLLDILMPGLDGYAVLREIKADESLRHIGVIMISALDELGAVVRCIEGGAEDYLSKPFEPALLRARIGASLEKKKFRDQEQSYLHTIEETQRRLSGELDEAANYVRSILPEPVTEPVAVDWRYIPSTELGGDSFGYHWMDEGHFAIYLLDVCGHGVGASLLAVTAINVIRSGSLASVDFKDPSAVLGALNEAFPMEKQNNMYFTIWYGVYSRNEGVIRYASAGHPAPVFLPAGGGAPVRLSGGGLMIGAMPGVQYKSAFHPVGGGGELIVFSDGIYELRTVDGAMLGDDDLEEFLASTGAAPGILDRLVERAYSTRGTQALDDDFSALAVSL